MIFKAFNRLNRHTKVAVFVAPILAILGFAASDLWFENKAMKTRLFEMKPTSNTCDIAAKSCVLASGEFQISLYLENGITTLNSTFPLDTATLFLVNPEGDAAPFRMGMKDSPYYWYRETPLSEVLTQSGSEQMVRMIATVKGGQYFAEVKSVTR